MWKESFIKEGSLTAPQVNDLYNRESQNIVDKLQNMFTINIKAILIGCAIMLVMMTLIGAPFLGIYICCLIAPLLVLAKKELKKSVNLSKDQSSYDYIMSFDSWLKNSTKVIASYYRIFYPMFFLGMAIQGVVSETGGMLMTKLLVSIPTDILIFGLPYYVVIVIAAITLVFAKYAETLYRLDINIVYGTQFKKLEALIKDMKALRNES
jgi:hypothetical protein